LFGNYEEEEGHSVRNPIIKEEHNLLFQSPTSTPTPNFPFPFSNQTKESGKGKMAISMSKCSRIRHIVRLRQMLRRWRSKARMSAHRGIPSDVPAGHVAVCVGSNSRRFVVRATYLNHPVFKKLLVEAEEEYGFSNHGPLAIPCDETLFEQLLRFVSRSGAPPSFCSDDCHLPLINNLDFFLQSQTLLH